jgi:hypothetical protein
MAAYYDLMSQSMTGGLSITIRPVARHRNWIFMILLGLHRTSSLMQYYRLWRLRGMLGASLELDK